MTKVVPPDVEAAPLEQRIRKWIEDNPVRAQAGERMLEQLTRIRGEFQGDTALRLEGLVEETLTRQLRIDESKRAGLEAAKQLSDTVQKLTESMSQCLLTAKKAHDAALGAAMSAMQTQSKVTAQSRPSVLQTVTLAKPKGPDKKLIN
ncbi:MAG: hypothetical protein GY811_29430 [Myxococcales bacterium]|nr:hypothetical protein [Myxococcales bacterium]